MIGYLVLFGMVQMCSILWPDLFLLSLDEMLPFIKLFTIMVPIVVLTSLCSFLQLEEVKQLLALKIGLGSICCVEKDQFRWALERQYQTVINHILNSGEEELFSKLEYDFIDAEKLENLFQSVCSKGWRDVVDKLMKHPEYKDFILSSDNQGQSGFMKAIDNGHVAVMKLLLEHPLNHDIAIKVIH